jgi:tripartite-type tricarboxylate transporter receptor subunit TctC
MKRLSANKEYGMTTVAARLLLGAFMLASPLAWAQEAIPKLIRIVVPFSAGASNDAIARAIAPLLAKRLDTNVLVENRPGAGSVIGSDAVAKGPKDGSMLLLTSSTFLTSAATTAKLPYDVNTSFVAIAGVGQNPSIFAVSASSPWKSMPELLAAARAKPDEITYGTAGVGSSAHMSTELLLADAKVQMRHVPYKGAANAAIDLAGGQIDTMMSSYGTLASFIKSGKVRVIATTGHKPHPSFPNVPLMSASVPGYEHEVWVGVFAPAGTPPRLVERLNREINEISKSPELKPLFEPDAISPMLMTQSQFSGYVRGELAQWKQIATARRIVAE